MIERILPSWVVSVAARRDPAEAVLFPEEEEFVVRAVDKRRREFATVRWCARRALATLGLPPVPILPGEAGAPGWPDGVVGSMTHCDGYRAAAVARERDADALGIDAEPHSPLPEGVLEAIARDEERELLWKLTRSSPDLCWDRLLFSAKESVYKAWFPANRRWLGFEDASVTLDSDGSFVARILVPDAKCRELTGTWLVADGLVATAIAVARYRPSVTGQRSAQRGTAMMGREVKPPMAMERRCATGPASSQRRTDRTNSPNSSSMVRRVSAAPTQ